MQQEQMTQAEIEEARKREEEKKVASMAQDNPDAQRKVDQKQAEAMQSAKNEDPDAWDEASKQWAKEYSSVANNQHTATTLLDAANAIIAAVAHMKEIGLGFKDVAKIMAGTFGGGGTLFGVPVDAAVKFTKFLHTKYKESQDQDPSLTEAQEQQPQAKFGLDYDEAGQSMKITTQSTAADQGVAESADFRTEFNKYLKSEKDGEFQISADGTVQLKDVGQDTYHDWQPEDQEDAQRFLGQFEDFQTSDASSNFEMDDPNYEQFGVEPPSSPGLTS